MPNKTMATSPLRYFVLYKPFQVMCQFSAEGEKRTLKDLGNFPSDVYPVGRLDYDSEGLLILTNDKSLNKRLLDPKNRHQRTYLVQVEGAPEQKDVEIVKNGITITVNKKKYHTLPANAKVFTDVPELPERIPPIRFRKSVPDTWMELVLHEGKNRQVRKMTAALGFPTLRLVRHSIGNVRLNGLQPGESIEWTKHELYAALFS